jgi:MEMO1 family protein
MNEIRRPVFAGSWYPDDAQECLAQIETFLEPGLEPHLRSQSWQAGIVPHAGWYYSGSIACNVIACLKESHPIDVVVIFGMHLHPDSSSFLMPRGAWGTPLGDLPVAADLADHLMQHFKFQKETTRRFSHDNTIELQLPFIKALLDPGAILALGVPPAPAALEIGRATAEWAVRNGKRMKVIGSTDLTHYGRNYGFTPHGSGPAALEWVRQENDHRVIEAMLALAPEKIIAEGLEHQNACCAGAAAAAVTTARKLGARAGHTLAYATSHDKSPGESFVGYVGLLFGA